MATIDKDELTLGFDEIERICGFGIDHSFLNFKKELKDCGYEVVKISLKNKTVSFVKTTENKAGNKKTELL